MGSRRTAGNVRGTTLALGPDAYVVQKSFAFKGVGYRPGDPVSEDVFNHRRFENLVSSGMVKAVRR
jgi:hypothetical protein